jgi:arginyl-tRNA synthetase
LINKHRFPRGSINASGTYISSLKPSSEVASSPIESSLFWENREVAPFVHSISASGKDVGSEDPVFVKFVEILKSINDQLQPSTKSIIPGASDVTSADIVLASDLYDLFTSHSAIKNQASTLLPSLSTYLASVFSRDFFAEALALRAAAVPVKSKAAAKAEAKLEKKKKDEPKKSAAPGSLLTLATLGSIVAGGPDTASANFLSASIERELIATFSAALRISFPSLIELGIEVDLHVNENPAFFHQFQCNNCLSLPGKLKGRPDAPANPRAAAERLISVITENASNPSFPVSNAIGKLEASGPGYINIYFSGAYLSQRLIRLLSDFSHHKKVNASSSSYVAPPPLEGTKQRVVVDYSSPNIAKEMHIGHLRSTMIGDALARIIEYIGHDVIRVNHVGDWGTQFGMLLAHLKDLQASGRNIDVDIADLSNFYKAAKQRFDKEEEFKVRAQREVVALQSGEEENLALWRRMVSVSESMFNKVYRLLGIDSRLMLKGESFYNSYIPAVVEEMQQKQLTSVAEGGALVVFVPGYEVPLMLRKSDGGFGYDSTDLTALKYRISDYGENATWIFYVIDSGQALHCDLVFHVAQMAGWYKSVPASHSAAPAPSPAPANSLIDYSKAVPCRVEHVGFGVVQGEDRRKFKSRDGGTVKLLDVLEEARTRIKTLLLERIESGLSAVPLEDVDRTSEILGYGGVKYFDLKQSRTNDYVFNYDRMLSPDGDTAVYLQYAHARLMSILRKASEKGYDVESLLESTVAAPGASLEWSHSSELALAIEISKFQSVIEKIINDLCPHHLCEYLYSLATSMSTFHRDCNVLGDETTPEARKTRLLLCVATGVVMRQVFELLGIVPLDRM